MFKLFEKAFCQMKLFLILPVALALNSVQALAGNKIYECLHGKIQSASCINILRGYWSHKDVIENAANRYNIPVSLLKAQIAYESGYNKDARSHVGAKGLSQIMPATAQYLKVSYSNLNTPDIAVDAGAKFMSQLYQDFGRWDLALAAYNAGPMRVKRAGYKIPRIRETQDYVQNILRLEKAFRDKEGSKSSVPNNLIQDTVISTHTNDVKHESLVKVSSNINQNQNFIPPKRSERVNATLPVRTKEGWEQGEKLSQARHKNNSQNVYHVSNHVVAKKNSNSGGFHNSGNRQGYWNSGVVSIASEN